MSNIIDKIQLSGTNYDIQDSNATRVVEITQSDYDNLPSSAKTSNIIYIITDGSLDYITSAQCQTQINNSISGKQDTLSAGTNITIVDNVISAEGGGGKAVVGGRGITVTSGETADTVSFNLPISAGTNNLDNITCCGSNTVSGQYAVSFGNNNTTRGGAAATFGRYNKANNYDNVAGGFGVTTNGNQASSFGQYTKTENEAEHSVGRYNVSNKANGTFGDSGNTLFSVGNGTAENARHNAFEIRQNGDIYLNDGSKLQDTVSATTANTTALGGLKLVKLSQSEYDSLATKDNSTLYVIVN